MAILKNSIVRKIGLATFLFVMIMFFSYYLFLNMQIKTHLEQQGKEHLMKESQYLCSEIVAFLQKYVLIVEQAKNNRDFITFSREVEDRSKKRENPLFADVTKQLDEICNLDKNISQAYLGLAAASDIITSDYNYEISPNYDLSLRQWYINTIEENKTTITTPYIDLITNKTAISFTTPLIYEDEILGAFGIDILMEDLNQIMSDYNSKTDAGIGLVYKTGQILYNSGFNSATAPADMFVQDILSESDAQKLLSGNSGIDKYVFHGEEKYIAYIPVANTGLIVFTNILKSDLTSQVQRFMYINLSILLGILVVLTGFLFVLERILSKPLIYISREVENYSNNNSIYLPEKYINRNDEIGILSKGIAYMFNNISNYILKLEEMNEALHKAKEVINRDKLLFKTTLRSLGDGVISTDKAGNIQLMNKVAENLTGWENDEAWGLDLATVYNTIDEYSREKCPCPLDKVFKSKAFSEAGSCALLINKNGDEVPIEDNAAPILDGEGNVTGAVIVFRDYTDKKQKQARISYLSYHDQLTGLYNRHFFEEALKSLDMEESLPLSLAMLDVNGLKLTNDAFGHQMGDKLLLIVAEAMTKACGADELVYRVGGDEFVLLLPKTSYQETEAITKLIYQEIEMANLNDIIISVSIGWDTKTSMEQNIMEVYARAEEYMYRKKLTESQSMRSKTIQVVMKTLNETNQRERIHSENVSKLSRQIGEILKLDSEVLREIETAGLLHDIGKIAIDSNLLNKPAKLTDSEYEVIKRHPEVGYHILKSADAYSSLSDYVLSHHERWDGKGYPRGLKGLETPLVARIISIADAYEAMIAERPYRKSMSKEDAFAELIRCSGTQFDPVIITAITEHFGVDI